MLAVLLRGFLDRLLLVGAVVAGGLVPGFIAQYRQRLGGRLDQARIDLAAWQQVADRFFQGDLEKLIRHHLESSDAALRAEGGIIEALLADVQRLEAAMAALRGNLFEQAAYLLVHPDPNLLRATFADWVPTFSLSPDGLIFALLVALAIWLVFQALWELVARGGRRALRVLRGGPHPVSPAPRR